MTEIVPITAYLEAYGIEPNGICCPSYLNALSVKDNIQDVMVTAPIAKPNKDGSIRDLRKYEITALIKKTSASVMDCMYCLDPCQDETETITVGSQTVTLTLPPPVQGNCGSSCQKQIHWYQQTKTVSQPTPQGIIKKTVPQPYINIDVNIPKICGLIGLELQFEVSHKYNSNVSLWGKGSIPEDNSLAHAYDSMKGIWTITYPFNVFKDCFFPGEQITAYAQFEVDTKNPNNRCNPIPIAYGYFETRCFTSGVLSGCGLLDGSNNIIAGGNGYGLNSAWIGDSRLKWQVKYKGAYYWIACSDFAGYNLGDRAIIYKNGLGVLKGSGKALIQITDHKCRNNDSFNSDNAPELETLFTDACVSYVLNPNSDIIMPVGVY